MSSAGGKVSVARLSNQSTSGTVNSSGTKLGNLSFADDIEILDANSDGDYARIYPSRLAGVSLTSDDIRYYELDENGNMSRLILNDVTGDLYSYGILTRVSELSKGMSASSYYEYIINGTAGTLSSSTTIYSCLAHSRTITDEL